MTREKKSHEELFQEFLSESHQRWQRLTSERPREDPARLSNGLFESAFAVVYPKETPSLKQLRDKIEDYARNRNAWRHLFTGEHNRARPIGKAIETLYPAQCERIAENNLNYYWRMTSDAKLYLLRPFGRNNAQSNADLDIVTPISCVAHALNLAANVCELWGHESEFHFSCRFAGLHGMQLSSQNFGTQISVAGEYHCCNNEMSLDTVRLSKKRAKVEAADILLQLLSPLYEQFNYFPLSKNNVVEVLNRVQM